MDLEKIFKVKGFDPTENQRQAIFHTDGPLFLPAGPGSGKTRVLLWRTVNLIVNEQVPPENIFLATFTEKAAKQLKEGLRAYLGEAAMVTGKNYDLSQMYIGTVHSLCQKILSDRRFRPGRRREKVPRVLDELEQIIFVTSFGRWQKILGAAGLTGDKPNQRVNAIFGGRSKNSNSKQKAVAIALRAFNRFSEECIDPEEGIKSCTNDDLKILLMMYGEYLKFLREDPNAPATDLSLLQQDALNLVMQSEHSANMFKYLIVDEYQDTNYVQERLYFELAKDCKNLCVVGDDDQALYRFRGATVENFVRYPDRIKSRWGINAKEIPLDVNFRSRSEIVDVSIAYLETVNWSNLETGSAFRIESKKIKVGRKSEAAPSVVVSGPGSPENCADEIAALVKRLIESKAVKAPNQIAFLYPSLKNKPAQTMMAALEDAGVPIYAPRAQRFLENEEVQALFGLLGKMFGIPQSEGNAFGDWGDYLDWLNASSNLSNKIIAADKKLEQFLSFKRNEIEEAVGDFNTLNKALRDNGLDMNAIYRPIEHKMILMTASGLSEKAKKSLNSKIFNKVVQERLSKDTDDRRQKPFTLNYVVRATTAVDWTLMDLYWQFMGFDYFKKHLDAAANEGREREAINLSLVSQYLERFLGQGSHVLTANDFVDERMQRRLFGSYIYTLFARQESEHEDVENPFPRECVPFLTIHQSKGLEFPVVVLGDTKKKHDGGPRLMDELVRSIRDSGDAEPLDRSQDFDTARLYYTGLSRAQNLLVLPNLNARYNKMNKNFQEIFDSKSWTTIEDFELASMPPPPDSNSDVPKTFSYTSDFLFYKRCPRQYMIFRELEFVPSRTQSMVFGSLIHQTIEDLHHMLIAERNGSGEVA